MRRRILRPRPDASVDEAHDVDTTDPRPDTVPGPGATAGDTGEQWEDWEESESERVARWLRSKVRPDLEVIDESAAPEHSYDFDVVHLEDTQAARQAASRAETEVWRLDQERRRLATEVEAERAQAERARREQLDAWARLEQEMSQLDQRRRRLAEAVEAERQEVERVRQEQLEARARLESAVAELDQQRHRLTAMEAERSQAELARQEHADARAALAAEVAAIDEQRQRLMAAVETERSETERARRAHVDARSRLETEMAELDVQRRRLVEAVEAERAEAERARLEQLEAKARLEAEVADLDRERQRLLASMEADRAEAARVETERAGAAEASAAETTYASDEADAAGDDAPDQAGAGGPGSATGRHFRSAGATARSRRRRLAAAQVDPVARPTVVRLSRPPAAENAQDAPERSLSLAEQREHEQEQARARLADALAELARHVATMQSAERTEAEWTRHWELEARAREAEAEAAAAERRRWAALEGARVDATRRRRWLLGAVLAVAVLAPLAIDVASLMAARSRLAGVAEDAALSAAADLSQQGDRERARRVAQAAADTEGVVLEEFAVDAGDVRVVVRDEASSLVLGHLAPTRDWYDVRATAAASAAGAAPVG